MLAELDKAVDTKDPNTILKALEPFITASNEKFLKPVEKLSKHKSRNVRVMATHVLGSQPPAKKAGIACFKVMMSRQNKGQGAIIAMAISSMRRQKFDSRALMKEFESFWRKRADTEVMKQIVKYYGDLDKIGTVKDLVEWVEAPQPASVNSASNPPASYWKRMWEIWDAINKDVRIALFDLTGKEYTTVRQWKVWLDSTEARKMGIR